LFDEWLFFRLSPPNAILTCRAYGPAAKTTALLAVRLKILFGDFCRSFLLLVIVK